MRRDPNNNGKGAMISIIVIFVLIIASSVLYTYLPSILFNRQMRSIVDTYTSSDDSSYGAASGSGSTNVSGTTDVSDDGSYTYTNSSTGYTALIEDDAELLTDTEKATLLETMKSITSYGHVAFKSIDTNRYSSTSSFANSYYSGKFGTSSGTVFVIDMDERNIWIHSNGRIYSTVTTSYANVITDNVYTYASAKNYLKCAQTAFEQEYTLLSGSRISQPMKYISNALLAVAAAIIINYIIVRMASRTRKANDRELVSGVFVNNAFNDYHVVHLGQTKVYSPQSSSSSSGSSHSGGGGGGGGSSHSSGGGGGHSF